MTQLAAITKEQFASKAWTHAGYTFAQKEHLIPVVTAELSQLVPAMPLVFVPVGESYELMGLTSVQPGNNLYVAPKGQWMGDYIPAALRAYPFRLVRHSDRDESVLCFDTNSGRLVDAGQGEAFFDAEGG